MMAGDEAIPEDVPEADALEQRREAVDHAEGDTTAEPGDDSIEVPEADALEQSRIVPTDDEPDPEV